MHVINIHERFLAASPEAAGALLDRLGGPDDPLWPAGPWPAMKLDAPLGVGARGGHGPVRYHVVEYEPGRRVRFAFDPQGLLKDFRGHHEFELIPRPPGVLLRHTIDAQCGPGTWVKWLVGVGPLHDAVLEDLLDRAQTALGQPPATPARWSWYVRLLRRTATKRRIKP